MNTEQPISHPNDLQEGEHHLGALRGQAWLTVQTRQAQQLIRGRTGTPDKPAIIGLVGFADRLRAIWQAARNDDPYAHWWLIKVHETIEQARVFVRTRQSELDSQLEQVAGIEMTIAESLRPYRIPLRFANPYAYRGAQLLAEYDTLVRALLTGCHVGLLDRDSSEKAINLSARKIRGTFAVPQGYRFLGVDRESLQQDSDKWEQARQLMGELPDEVLSGEHRAPLLLRNVQFPKEIAGSVVLQSLASTSSGSHSKHAGDNG